MFLIPTYLGRSAIHGFGVFTATLIPAETVIWEFADGVDMRLTPSELRALSGRVHDALRSYCYREATGAYVLCGDNAKFMNHSMDPTCDDNGKITIVRRALPAGSELTCDYRSFDYDTIDGRGEWFTAADADTPT